MVLCGVVLWLAFWGLWNLVLPIATAAHHITLISPRLFF